MGKKSNAVPPPNNALPPTIGGEQATSSGIFSYLHDHVMYLNQS